MYNYLFNSKVVIRTPLFPYEKQIDKKGLIDFFSNKVVKEALFLSTPDLLKEFEKWEKKNFKDYPKEDKLLNSLLKYAVRMRTRSTPFGLLAGCNVIDGLQSKIIVASNNHSRKTRLDMNFSGELALELSKLSYIRKHLLFFPNSSIYEVQDQIRYIEYMFVNGSRNHQITAVNKNRYVQLIIKKSKNGIKITELIDFLVDQNVFKEDAIEFIGEIIESQLLVSELEPGVTGTELIDKIINVVHDINEKCHNNELDVILKILSSAQFELKQCDQMLGNPIDVYFEIAGKLKEFGVPIEMNRLFQTDLFPLFYGEKDMDGDDSFVRLYEKQISQAATVLNKLTNVNKGNNLDEFRKKFYDRYGELEIPMQEALDSELGIGYARNTNNSGDISPLINGISLPNVGVEKKKLNWNKVNSFLYKKLINALKVNSQSIKIEPEELRDFEENWDDLPVSMSVMSSHIGERDNKPLIYLKSFGGASAINYLGRFGQGNSDIFVLIHDIATREQEHLRPEVLAEIVHLPENRTGNILQRPVIRKFEIPYLASSSVSKEYQFPLDDLYLSIQNNSLVLRSKKKNLRVLPRLGNAHNYSFKSLPVYHFLCDLQFQNKRPGLFFNWGPLVNEFNFLPRVEVGNVLLSKATWCLIKRDFEEILGIKDGLLVLIMDWKKRWEMPNLLQLVDGDNELLVNLVDEMSINMFVSTIKNRSQIVLQEFIFDQDISLIKDTQERPFVNELIFTLEKKPPAKGKNTQVMNDGLFGAVPVTESTPISFSVGSEWIYLKIYCGVKSSDKLLVEFLKPFTEQLLLDGLIDSWFFIRFFDPEYHLRIRLHLDDCKNLGEVLFRFHFSINKFENSGYIRNIQFETYKREIMRYGVNSMGLSEELFFSHSVLTINMINLLEGEKGEEVRWLVAVRLIDVILTSFDYGTFDKMDIVETLKVGFGQEFGINKNLKLQLDKRYRLYRKEITSMLNMTLEDSDDKEPLISLIMEFEVTIYPISRKILALKKEGRLGLELGELISSHIHMVLNRIFRNNQRIHELIIYDFLWREYRSEIAQHKKNQKFVGAS